MIGVRKQVKDREHNIFISRMLPLQQSLKTVRSSMSTIPEERKIY